MELEEGNINPLKCSFQTDFRDVIREYWAGRCVNASDTDVINCENYDKLTSMEVTEILHIVPDVKGKKVLELAAGNG